MATNHEMIEEMAMLVGFEYDGENLKTFAEWAKEGLIVKKGEKAFMQLELWKPFTKKVVDENNKPVIDEKTGKQKEETRFMLKMSHLFTPEQVEQGELKKKAPAKKKPAAKKKKEKHTFVRVGA
jgi:phage terminase Nu1 subunit (DNA packaging protein)